MQTWRVTSARPCLEDETLLALARGELGESELPRAEEHLQGCADCRAVLAEAARTLTTERETSDHAPFTHIARYEVVALIGAGASGIVYRGFDPRLKRPVALKLLHPEERGVSPHQAQHLLREAQAMARLSDPHVVAVYDTGLHDGHVFLVMEYVDGVTLSEWLQATARSTSDILRVFGDAARGLSAAHEKGLIHRDFKPANVLVARDGRARVTDFGLARESEAWLSERQLDDQASTELYAPTRGLVGTPAYMAPELFEGARATRASDQFAFCVALFVALFGRHPFRAGEGIDLGELVTRVRGGTLQQPPFDAPSSERLFAVLRQGLSAAPAARFEDLRELMTALERAAGPRHRGLLLSLGLIASAAVALALTHRATPATPSPARRVTSESVASLPPVAPSAEPVPSASPAPAAPSAVTPARPQRVGAERRPAPKPTEVRYKDWLKDPFLK